MDKKFLVDVLEETVKRYNDLKIEPGQEKGFKYTAIATFQREWDGEAEDFLAMFKRATSDAIPMLDVQKSSPNGGLIKLMELGKVEEVRTAFKLLLSEDEGDIHLRQNRLRDFADRLNPLLQENGMKGNNYKLNLYNALIYLTLWRPEENFMVKVSEARTWCLALNYSPDIGTGVKFSLERYYEMCDRCLQEIRKCAPLLQLALAEAKAKGCEDVAIVEHLLMYELIHAAYNEIFVNQMGLDISKIDRIKASKQEYMALKEHNDRQSKLEQLETQTLLDRQLLVGKEVNSKKFGPGKIQSLEGETLAVAFGDQVKYFDLITCLKVNLLGLPEACFEAYRKDLQLREVRKELSKKLEAEKA